MRHGAAAPSLTHGIPDARACTRAYAAPPPAGRRTHTRQRLGLDGEWCFWPDVGNVLVAESGFVAAGQRTAALGEPRRARVPSPWQAQFEDLRLWAGVAWYERDMLVPASWRGRRVRLCFGAVDHTCTVWVNGRRAGGHDDGYLPFALDVTELVSYGERNTITVRVVDPGPGTDIEPRFAEIPHGKQSWYGPLGGIWQSAFAETSPSVYVDHAHVHGDARSGHALVRVALGAPASGGEAVEARVVAPDGLDTFVTEGPPLETGARGAALTIELGHPQLWELDAPRLYGLEVALRPSGTDADVWRDDFGLRTIEARSGMLLLNGAPLYVIGALDQDYYLGSIATPPSDDLLREQFLRARELGLNLLRCHIKVPDPRYLRWADRLGLLVWSEVPSWGVLSDASAARVWRTFEGMVRRDFNHPSIVAWAIVNESWGVDIAGDPRHRMWLAEMFERAKALDPTRLVVDNSACEPNFHVRTDVNDFHTYRAFPDQHESWRAWTRAWARDPASTFSPHGDADRRGDEPLVLSEFGNWGLPDVRNLLDKDGREPWWFDTGDEGLDVENPAEGVREQLAEGIVRPRGVRSRFDDWRLAEVFGSWDAFVHASQDHQFESLRESIGDLRTHDAIRGYVITELTDCHWECNGLLDMARSPKSYHHRAREINAPDVVVAAPHRRRYRAGQTVAVAVTVSHFSTRPLEPCVVEWSLPEAGIIGEPLEGAVARGKVASLGTFEVVVPELDAPRRAHVRAVLRDRWGREVNRSESPLQLYPAPVVDDHDRALVAARWEPSVDEHLRAGGRAMIVASDPGSLPASLGVSVQERAGTRWAGEWAQGMHWLRPAVTAGLPLLPRVDVTWAGMTPSCVLRGYTADAADDVLGGFYVGWLHSTVATIATFRRGAGGGVLCTFPLLQRREDPLADALLRRLAELAARVDAKTSL